MAHAFLKPSTISSAMLGLLEREIVLPRLVWRFGQADFTGQANDTMTIRVPARLTARDYEWRTRTAEIQTDDLTETKVNVTLNKHPYSAVKCTDEELTLDIKDFGAQVGAPQVRAVAERLENYLVAEMTASAPQTTLTLDPANPVHTIIDARQALNKAFVPNGDRVLVVDPEIESALLKTEQLLRVDASGSDSALRDATIGRIAGFTAVVSNALPAGTAYAFHKTAFVLATVAPTVPDGVTMGRSATYQDLGMRWIRDYDARFLQDRSIVSTFAGVAHVADGPDDADVDVLPEFVRAVRITAA